MFSLILSQSAAVGLDTVSLRHVPAIALQSIMRVCENKAAHSSQTSCKLNTKTRQQQQQNSLTFSSLMSL